MALRLVDVGRSAFAVLLLTRSLPSNVHGKFALDCCSNVVRSSTILLDTLPSNQCRTSQNVYYLGFVRYGRLSTQHCHHFCSMR